MPGRVDTVPEVRYHFGPLSEGTPQHRDAAVTAYAVAVFASVPASDEAGARLALGKGQSTLTSWRETRLEGNPGRSGAPKTEQAPWQRGAEITRSQNLSNTAPTTSSRAFGRGRVLVESLILAQDQRWRRA